MEKLKKTKYALGFAAGLAVGAGGTASQLKTEAEVADEVSNVKVFMCQRYAGKDKLACLKDKEQ